MAVFSVIWIRRDKLSVECLVGTELLSIGKTLAQPVAIESVDSRLPILPRVGNTGGTGEALIVVEEDPIAS